MKEDKIHSGPNGLEVWICNDPSVTQPFLEVSMGCFRFHMNLETLNFLLEGLSKAFYEIHKGKPFYNELTEFMSSGKSMVMALEKDSAVTAWRQTIGATNPEEAEKGTIRHDYATSIGKNAVHGSDSDENAKKEIGFFFTGSELITN